VQRLSWSSVCVCYESRDSQQAILALLFGLSSSQPLMGIGLCVLLTGKGYRVGVEWGKVRDSCRGVLERWFGAETMGRGGLRLAGNGEGTFMVTGF
ncbi:hypothetical protein Tco_0239366, partial [Tanacetum coccineum]